MKVNILIAGGSGHWSELNHYPAIRELRETGIEAKVVVICDPIDPYSTNPQQYKVGRANLSAILKSDSPLWINPEGLTNIQLKEELNKAADKYSIKVLVISTNPTQHYFYADWAVSRGINVLCDKPLIVVPDASWKPDRAKLIEERFNKLLSKVEIAQKSNPSYRFCTPLRRRALTPFIEIANGLEEVYKKTGQGLTYMTVVINGGVHRYPIEYLKGGAHGYIDGVGSLSHSSYHYLDVIAWYLQSALGDVSKIAISLPYVSRVKDYLATKEYRQLIRLNDEDSKIVETGIKVSQRALNAELDFTLLIYLYNEHDERIGLVSYSSNHTTFTSRTTKYDPKMLDHTNDKNGGRMSQVYFDIHQGPVQNWLLIKNDTVFQKDNIDITRRVHPKLGYKSWRKQYGDAYDKSTTTPRDLFIAFIKKSIGLSIPKSYDYHLQLLHDQRLTNKIFSSAYELIARQYGSPDRNDQVIINLKEFL